MSKTELSKYVIKHVRPTMECEDVAYHSVNEIREYSDIPAIVAATPQKDFGITFPIEKQKEFIHGYYASVSYIDAQVGLLLNRLDSLGLADNTIVVLWGDIGWHLGDHNLLCKHSNFEEATRSPLIYFGTGLETFRYKIGLRICRSFPNALRLCSIRNTCTPRWEKPCGGN